MAFRRASILAISRCRRCERSISRATRSKLMTRAIASSSTATTGRWPTPCGSCTRSSSREPGRCPRSLNGTAISRNGGCSRPRRPRPRRSSIDMPLRSSRRAAMPLEPIRLEPRKPQDSYAATFSSALLRPERETPSLIAGPKGKGAVKRYNVYRNNVTVSLIEALAAIFPAVRRITGEEFFRAMARFHIRETPPNSPLLFEYGGDFPAFIERYEYAQGMPWLADAARIERAWLDAYHAADAAPLTASDLASFPPERLADLVFAPHPATRLVRSRFAAVTIFAANRAPGPVEASQAEDPLITRREFDVVVRRL